MNDFVDEDLVIKGEIEHSSVPELLKSMLSSGEEGVLTFRNGDLSKTLYCQGGRVVFAASNNPDERLGEFLLVRGRISARHYIEASKRIRPGVRLGGILVELGAVEPEDLLNTVEAAVREVLLDLFTWTRGEYEFVMKSMDMETMVTVTIPTEGLILEGIRRTRSWHQVITAIGSIDTVFFPTGATDVLYKLELTEEEQEVLAQVNGRSNVEHICQVSYLPNFETCRTLWALQVLGIVRRTVADDAAVLDQGDQARQGAMDLEEIVEKFNQMFSRVYGFLKGRVGDSVDEFMDACLEEVSRQYGALFHGVDLKHYGRADFEQMLANVAEFSADQRKSLMLSGLNELVFVIQLTVRTRYGAQEEAVVSGIIKDGFRKLGQA
jgi:hypothetical protein